MTLDTCSARTASGIVRPARRPTGWVAPGPRPAVAEAEPRAGEDACYLLGDWRIYQRVDGHRWSLDDLVTAWLAVLVAGPPRGDAPRTVLDLGCGIGSVLLMCAWHFGAARLTGVEAQALSLDLARRSVAMNGIEDRVELVAGDLREVALPARAFDLVTGTPPYWPLGSASEGRGPQKGPCRLERRGGVEDYLRVAAGAVSDHGLVVMCHEARSRERLMAAARARALVPVARVDVVGRAGKPPLITVAAFARDSRAGARAGDIPCELVVRDRDGQWTEDFAALRRMMGMPTAGSGGAPAR